MARSSSPSLALALVALLAVAATVSHRAAAQAVVYDNFAAALDAQAPKGFSYAKRLVDALGLRSKYSDPTLVATMLVPTDKAFDALAASSGVTADQLLLMVQTNAVLKKLLGNAMAYNTIPNQVIGQFQFTDGQKVTTGHQGKQLTATKNAEGVFLSGDMNNKGQPAKIVNGNIKTKAGVAHGVNAVLLPFNLPRLAKP
jgi:uncharacterized surface protein with fasciclin (FAS1) repeats